MYLSSLSRHSLAAVLLAGVGIIAGCKREAIREYSVPKEQASTSTTAMPPGHPTVGSDMPHEMPPMPAPPKWTLPQGWAEKEPSSMRVANFVIAGQDGQNAEVGIIPLPSTGMEIELVNMWRQQLRLPDIASAEVDKQSSTVTIGSEPGKLYDMASTEPLVDGKFKARMLIGMVTRGTMSWFFKMTGSEALVGEQKSAFLDFLKSISFPEVTTPMAVAKEEPTGAPAAEGLPQWQPPAAWRAQKPGPMVLASFSAGDDAAKALISISSFPGDVGGLLANINRWRGQVGLGPLESAALPQQVTTLDNGATLVDFKGTDLSTSDTKRLVGVIVPHAGQTWFYKMAGNETVVGQQKDAFIKFVQTVKYPDVNQ